VQGEKRDLAQKKGKKTTVYDLKDDILGCIRWKFLMVIQCTSSITFIDLFIYIRTVKTIILLLLATQSPREWQGK
jgi:hypothetical protein